MDTTPPAMALRSSNNCCHIFNTFPIWKTFVFSFHPGLGKKRKAENPVQFHQIFKKANNIKRTSACSKQDVRRTGGPSGAVNVGPGSACAAMCNHQCRTGQTYVTNGPWGWGMRTGDRIHPRLQGIHLTTLEFSKRQLESCRRLKTLCQMLDTILGMIWRLCACALVCVSVFVWVVLSLSSDSFILNVKGCKELASLWCVRTEADPFLWGVGMHHQLLCGSKAASERLSDKIIAFSQLTNHFTVQMLEILPLLWSTLRQLRNIVKIFPGQFGSYFLNISVQKARKQ